MPRARDDAFRKPSSVGAPLTGGARLDAVSCGVSMMMRSVRMAPGPGGGGGDRRVVPSSRHHRRGRVGLGVWPSASASASAGVSGRWDAGCHAGFRAWQGAGVVGEDAAQKPWCSAGPSARFGSQLLLRFAGVQWDRGSSCVSVSCIRASVPRGSEGYETNFVNL